MSYARMGCDGSDVYVYESDSGFICHWCSMHNGKMWIEDTIEGMIAHLEDHRKNGDTVPDGTFEQLKADKLVPA